LLSEALTATGVAGRPEEYLRQDWFAHFCSTGRLAYEHRLDHWPDGHEVALRGGRFRKLLSDDDVGSNRSPPGVFPNFLTQVRAAGTCNSVFGVKLHRNQLEAAVDALNQAGAEVDDVMFLSEWLPSARFIFLKREDAIRRAVSHYRAISSGIWWDDGRRTTPSANIDPAVIDVLLRRAAIQETAWEDFFRRANTSPLRLTYEELVVDLAEAVRRVLVHVGARSSIKAKSVVPRLVRQSDEWTEEAVHRYVTWRRTHRPSVNTHYGFEMAG